MHTHNSVSKRKPPFCHLWEEGSRAFGFCERENKVILKQFHKSKVRCLVTENGDSHVDRMQKSMAFNTKVVKDLKWLLCTYFLKNWSSSLKAILFISLTWNFRAKNGKVAPELSDAKIVIRLHIVWKLINMSHLNFCILAFSPILSFWPQTSGCFQKFVLIDHFASLAMLNETLVVIFQPLRLIFYKELYIDLQKATNRVEKS